VTVRRLVLTTTAMAALAVVLRALTGPWDRALATLEDAPTVTTTSGPEQVVLAAAGLLAWAAWGWGTLGLLLTAASAAPGAGGALARGISRWVLPAGLRSTAGLALGVGLVVAAPAAVAAPPATPSAVSVPDWPGGDPASAPAAPPDWPTASPRAAQHTVVPGECLWLIAEDQLRDLGRDPTDAEVERAVDRWWAANRDVLGPDPDLIHPGQVLTPPTGTPAPPSTESPSRSTR
jgi:hypothetical protein